MLKYSLLFLLLLLAPKSFSQIYSTENAHAEVSGETSFVSYTGKSNELKGEINLKTKKINFGILLSTIDTDNSLRNKHMNEALETSKYPTAEFSGQIISSFDENKKESQLVKVKGNFSIHGKTKPLELNATLKPEDDELKFSATWPILITEFEIERPSAMFMKVDDKHIIAIQGTLQRRSTY